MENAKKAAIVLGAILMAWLIYTIGEGDGYCHAKFPDNPAVCDVP